MKKHTMRLRLLLLASMLTALACGDDSAPADASSTPDVGEDAESGPACLREIECDDGLYCNGVEACDPTATEGDGCVPGEPPCDGIEECDPTSRQCVSCVPGGPNDLDGDGYCSPGADCDDGNGDINPGVEDICLGPSDPSATLDEDCDPTTVGNRDSDRDGYMADYCCNGDTCGRDCRDEENIPGLIPMTLPFGMGPEDVHPETTEVCGDGVDNNCDGEIDGFALAYPDLDGDGRGDPGPDGEPQLLECGPLVSNTGDDCDDANPLIYFGAPEICDGFDNSCTHDGPERAAREDGDPDYVAGGPLPQEDRDGDHYTQGAVTDGAGMLTQAPYAGCDGGPFPKTDCHEAVIFDVGGESRNGVDANPGLPEACFDMVDNNCNGEVDETRQRLCRDYDHDGHGDAATLEVVVGQCDITCDPEDEYCLVPEALCDDCDDRGPRAAERFPGNVEYCDRFDSDCSSGGSSIAVDEDGDDDGYAAIGAMCLGGEVGGAPAGTFVKTDCDDSNIRIHPGAVELCDGVDANCSEALADLPDEPAEDADGDGYSPIDAVCLGVGDAGAPGDAYPRTDCDDTRRTVNPGVSAAADMSSCDGLDNDCNPATTELAHPCGNGLYCDEGGVCAWGGRVVAISSVGHHTCALRRNGQVTCWGHVPGGATDVSSPAVGISRDCLVLATGGVWCFGGAAQSSSQPLAELDNITMLGVGPCGVGQNGTVSCWNEGVVTGLTDVSALSSGCAVQADAVSCWAGGRAAEFMAAGDARYIAGGGRYGNTCVVHLDGTASCWGRNGYGQLGDGTTFTPEFLGEEEQLDAPTNVLALTDIQVVHPGPFHTCAIANGNAYCWGHNDSGKLGHGGSEYHVSMPVPVNGLGTVLDIRPGSRHTCALRIDGTVWCWGSNQAGQLGPGRATHSRLPIPVAGLGTYPQAVESLYNGAQCVLMSDTTLHCSETHFPMLQIMDDVVDFVHGGSHDCAILSDRTATCWTSSQRQSIATGYLLPTPVVGLPSVESIVPGYNHTCAIDIEGDAWCWGSNADGRLGDGTEIDRSNPTQVIGIDDVASIAAGDNYTCAVKTDGTVWCWGDRTHLGQEMATHSLVPVEVPEIDDARSVSAGGDYVCVLRADESLWCWGGIRVSTIEEEHRTLVPERIDIEGVEFVAADGSHSCAVASGAVWCWGLNSEGQLGNGSTVSGFSPVRVARLDSAIQVSVDSFGTCALSAEHLVACWGRVRWAGGVSVSVPSILDESLLSWE